MADKNFIRFNTSNREFQTELKIRVDNYFRENKLSKKGNANMYIKTLVMLLAYLAPYVLIVFHVFDNKLIWLFLTILMGFSMAGIGMCIMHDANHGSYSKHEKLNRILGYFSISLLSGNSLNWRIQHNIIHHTYTNIHAYDEDIAPIGFLRFEPHAKKRKIHKFQFLYAWFLYGLMTVMWSLSKDFKQIVRYNKQGFLNTAKTTFTTEFIIIVVSKLLYFTYMLLPYFVIKEITFLEWLTGYLLIHYIAGFTLALIFQIAHITGESEFPLAGENGELKNNFAEHQLRTTINFSPKNKVLSWLIGGLNYQVEHHLFPNICHVHYNKISKIVEDVAREFNLPYKTEKTFFKAVLLHGKMLWSMGNN